jgi:predicted small integral membrane protein
VFSGAYLIPLVSVVIVAAASWSPTVVPSTTPSSSTVVTASSLATTASISLLISLLISYFSATSWIVLLGVDVSGVVIGLLLAVIFGNFDNLKKI